MAKDIYLDENNDLVFDTNGRITLVEGASEVAQRVRNRLLMLKGEWDFDVRLGLRYRLDFFRIGVSLESIESIVRDYLLSTDGVTSIYSLELTKDDDNKLTVSVTLVTDEGAVSVEA